MRKEENNALKEIKMMLNLFYENFIYYEEWPKSLILPAKTKAKSLVYSSFIIGGLSVLTHCDRLVRNLMFQKRDGTGIWW